MAPPNQIPLETEKVKFGLISLLFVSLQYNFGGKKRKIVKMNVQNERS